METWFFFSVAIITRRLLFTLVFIKLILRGPHLSYGSPYIHATLTIVYTRLKIKWRLVVTLLFEMCLIFLNFTFLLEIVFHKRYLFLRREPLSKLVFAASDPTTLRYFVWDRIIQPILRYGQNFIIFLDQVLKKISEVNSIETLFKFLNLLNLLIEMVFLVLFRFVLELPMLYFYNLSVLSFKLVLKEI